MLCGNFEKLQTIYLFNFPFFVGCDELWITETADMESADTGTML
jgi:hypothetical protein